MFVPKKWFQYLCISDPLINNQPNHLNRITLEVYSNSKKNTFKPKCPPEILGLQIAKLLMAIFLLFIMYQIYQRGLTYVCCNLNKIDSFANPLLDDLC